MELRTALPIPTSGPERAATGAPAALRLIPGGLDRRPLTVAPPIVRPKPGLVPNATLVEREEIAAAVVRLVVRPDAAVPAFAPGQYFSLGLNLEAGPVLRPYSTASPAGTQDRLEFLVRRVREGEFTPTLWTLAVGDRLWIGPPKGLFKLQPDDDRDHLLVSAGTGIAPFLSMADALLRRLAPPRVILAHGVSHLDELAYRQRLEELATGKPGFVYAPTVSRPDVPANSTWRGRTGRVETILAPLWSELGLAPETTVAYLCGNPEMVEASRQVLLGLGMPAESVIHENYWAPAAPRA